MNLRGLVFGHCGTKSVQEGVRRWSFRDREVARPDGSGFAVVSCVDVQVSQTVDDCTSRDCVAALGRVAVGKVVSAAKASVRIDEHANVYRVDVTSYFDDETQHLCDGCGRVWNDGSDGLKNVCAMFRRVFKVLRKVMTKRRWDDSRKQSKRRTSERTTGKPGWKENLSQFG